jgi:hypothetical protein
MGMVERVFHAGNSGKNDALLSRAIRSGDFLDQVSGTSGFSGLPDKGRRAAIPAAVGKSISRLRLFIERQRIRTCWQLEGKQKVPSVRLRLMLVLVLYLKSTHLLAGVLSANGLDFLIL